MASPSAIQSFILNQLTHPVVWDEGTKNWGCAKWTLNDWSCICNEKLFLFRVAKKNIRKNGPLWEGEADQFSFTLKDFISWLQNDQNTCSPITHFPRERFWCYSSYNYMEKIFHSNPEILEAVDWSSFGFEGRHGQQSTLWIGSEGAHTPCHQDTYGCNLVAQLCGSKLWVLFPPEDGNYLYPTRIPYEESSIFSSVNIHKPNYKEHPQFQFAHPHTIILKPGQVLFVPALWWHYVECLTPAISINTWIELSTDNEKRLEEAITRSMLTALVPTYEPDDDEWVNPSEDLVTAEETMGYVSCVLKKLQTVQSEVTDSLVNRTRDSYTMSNCLNDVKIDERVRSSLNFVPVTSIKALEELMERNSCLEFEETINDNEQSSDISTLQSSETKDNMEKNEFLRKFMRCLTHPEVISLISNKVKEAFL